MAKLPLNKTLTAHAKTVGLRAKFFDLRDGYKLEGMNPREAAVRAYTELGIGKLMDDHRRRQTQGEILGRGVALTPAEMAQVNPQYKAASVTEGSEIGEDVLSMPEQIRWVKQQLARVRNGGDPPVRYPNADALYWYQIAITRPADFDKIVLKIEAPEKDAEDVWMRDGQYQFSQIEGQLQDALREVAGQMAELEAAFVPRIESVFAQPATAEGVA